MPVPEQSAPKFTPGLIFIIAIFLIAISVVGVSRFKEHQLNAAQQRFDSDQSRLAEERNKPKPVRKEPVKATSNPNKVLVDIHKIINKTPAEVAKVLGQPKKIDRNTEETAYNCAQVECLNAQYGDKFLIDYVEGKSAWVMVFEVSPPSFGPDVITLLGLPETKPVSMGEGKPGDVIIWKPAGFEEIWYHSPGHTEKKGTLTVRTRKYMDGH